MEENYNKVILKALAEIRRRQILATKANPQTKYLYSDAFAHAVMHSIYPIYEEQFGTKDSITEILDALPFYETYDVSFELVMEVAELLNERCRKKQKITFYDVEELCRSGSDFWKSGNSRKQLINICRYLYLSNKYDKEFWLDLMSNSPTEACLIMTGLLLEEFAGWS